MDNIVYTSGSATTETYQNPAGTAPGNTLVLRHVFGSGLVQSQNPSFIADGNYQILGVVGWPSILGSNGCWANVMKISAGYPSPASVIDPGLSVLTNSISLQTSTNTAVVGTLVTSNLTQLALGDQLYVLLPGGNASFAAGAGGIVQISLQRI